jgi:5'-3' exonuclease
MKLKRRSIHQTTTNTLLIDGESLLKQGFYGTKDIKTHLGSVGTIYHFVNTIRRFYNNLGITKAIIFWEGENSKEYRRIYYPFYKLNRTEKVDIDAEHDLHRQRIRIKQYLEELFIRQVEIDECEGDDAIAYYVKNAPHEDKIIYTNDHDLLQLIDPTTKLFLWGKQALIDIYNFNNYFKYNYKNVGLVKMICGDVADNISGLESFGETTVLKLFPELKTEVKDYKWLLKRVDELLLENPKNNKLKILKEGKTKHKSYGIDYFSIMNVIINLETPHVTENMKKVIQEVIYEPLDPTDRGGIPTILKYMEEDGILYKLPKDDELFSLYWLPFLNIMSKEKKFFKDKTH